MTTKITLPCGLNKDGKLIYIDEAKNGLSCECVCPACKQPLVAKNGGKKREHHFAHLNVVECEHGYQSALHYMAKDCFLEMKELTFTKNGIPVRYKIDSVELEKKVSDIIPDILVTCDGKRFIVEIYVTHAVDDEKKEKIKSLQMSAVEIDLSRFRNETIDKETLKAELCNTANFTWVYDADIDLIAQKREIIQQFGLRLKTKRGGIIGCPYAQTYVTRNFCEECVFCCKKDSESIYCGINLPLLLRPELRNATNILVNQNKIMTQAEAEHYNQSHFGWKMRETVNQAIGAQLLFSRRW